MSDSERTPWGSARVNSERFQTELAAVWYAANYYYAASYHRGAEYIGVVFRGRDKRFGITVRNDGGFIASRVKIGDVPRGTVPTAVWHTHVPSSSAKTFEGEVFLTLLTSFDMDWNKFSSADRELAENATAVSMKLFGRPISIYLVTDRLIRRYRPGARIPERTWSKEPPSSFRPR